jgi:hypothetical protein
VRKTVPIDHSRDSCQRQSDRDVPVVIVPKQSGDDIRMRRDIRETFHDSKALTIKRKRR